MIKRSILAIVGLVLVGCQTIEPQTAAVLESADAETLASVKAVLAEAMQKASVDIGPGDLTQMSVISVLPPPLGPLEGNSTALPVQFDIMKAGEQCFVVRRDSGESFPLIGVSCRAIAE